MLGEIRRLTTMAPEELMTYAKEIGAPYGLVVETAQLGLIRESVRLRDARLRVTPLYGEQLMLTARPEHPFVAEGPIPPGPDGSS